MRIIVCGSRHWDDGDRIENVLAWYAKRGPVTVVHGDAPGADRLAGRAARKLGLSVEAHPAEWDKYGRRAGPIRNRKMLESGVDLVLAFKNGFDRTFWTGGTEHMVSIALEQLVPVVVRDSEGKVEW